MPGHNSGKEFLETYDAEIIMLTPLRIGMGSDLSLLPILRENIVVREKHEITREHKDIEIKDIRIERQPIIPASSIKGLLRSLTERIAKTIYTSIQSPPSLNDLPKYLALLHHQPAQRELEIRKEKARNNNIRLLTNPPLHQYIDSNLILDERKLTLNNRTYTIVPKELIELLEKTKSCMPTPPLDSAKDWVYEAFASRYCPICILYGSSYQAGAIRPTDAIPSRKTETVTRTRVTIDRWTRTKAEGMLYTEELVNAGTVFKARINILWPLPNRIEDTNKECSELRDNALKEAKKLWQITLQYLERSTVQLGAGKSRGQGLAKIILKPAQGGTK